MYSSFLPQQTLVLPWHSPHNAPTYINLFTHSKYMLSFYKTKLEYKTRGERASSGTATDCRITSTSVWRVFKKPVTLKITILPEYSKPLNHLRCKPETSHYFTRDQRSGIYAHKIPSGCGTKPILAKSSVNWHARSPDIGADATIAGFPRHETLGGAE